MKTKLLKKIRKRYVIIRIDELASNAGNVYNRVKEEYGLPFYVIKDLYEDAFEIRTQFYKTFEEAKNKLWKWILADYGEKFRHKDEKSSKVWWVKK